ncbi:hypothetical protein ACJIZ3_006096 [Penstemon smallii]|uniref:Uncharacterized protein n=1 Tax=Penstemon smallii TaxID=265156 RepID=A0ABD3S6Q2_9LAMI
MGQLNYVQTIEVWLNYFTCCYLYVFYVIVDGHESKGRRIRELTSVVQKHFKFPENGVGLYAKKVNNRGLEIFFKCLLVQLMRTLDEMQEEV